ncbi:MAG TPA: hypothetical protein VHV82_18185 [Sporichthyaceae bacterium]|jgi:hypothetical protein|nr:hypothetical protein [Sporichthyaceae bacterium]
MSVGRVSSFFAAAVLAAGMSVVSSPSAFADGAQDCMGQAQGVGLATPDAGQACSMAVGGDAMDCASMVKHDATPPIGDEAAADICSQAVPPPAPAGH